ncbi:MAG: D-glycero-beta-D-manno-heptose 1,7-bisphosphate 7-phosphatase [Deltaproteobacteria bacterium]|nr:D-glycero-beta-D-manno-heptose 1,7-bisphosphate 7-phosphatase [Deltaproteobacteria bacterium]
MPNNTSDPVVFLDRDGVINRDSPAYIKSLAEFEFLPRSLEALCKLTANGFKIILITNQSAIHRGMLPMETLENMHAAMMDEIQANDGKIDDIFFCPHTPQEGCACRKPKPGMIHRARDKHNIDLSAACMVGDSAKDIVCARRAGVGCSILVKTGDFARAQQELNNQKIAPDTIARDLFDAADWIIERYRKNRQSPSV